MNTDHIKYQSLSAVEAMDMHRTVEAREQELTDKGMKAGYDSGLDYAINHICAVESGACSVSDCPNYHQAYVLNCSESIVSECETYKGGGTE